MKKFTKKMRLRAKKEQVVPWSQDYDQREESVLHSIVIPDTAYEYRYIETLPLLPSKVLAAIFGNHNAWTNFCSDFGKCSNIKWGKNGASLRTNKL
jgi:hypothetical protein